MSNSYFHYVFVFPCPLRSLTPSTRGSETSANFSKNPGFSPPARPLSPCNLQTFALSPSQSSELSLRFISSQVAEPSLRLSRLLSASLLAPRLKNAYPNNYDAKALKIRWRRSVPLAGSRLWARSLLVSTLLRGLLASLRASRLILKFYPDLR